MFLLHHKNQNGFLFSATNEKNIHVFSQLNSITLLVKQKKYMFGACSNVSLIFL
jgi:hypothetical protein